MDMRFKNHAIISERLQYGKSKTVREENKKIEIGATTEFRAVQSRYMQFSQNLLQRTTQTTTVAPALDIIVTLINDGKMIEPGFLTHLLRCHDQMQDSLLAGSKQQFFSQAFPVFLPYCVLYFWNLSKMVLPRIDTYL